ncbi:MAG: single-stranded-DNA-specific exonuclease RecJ [Amphiplicatus sp.]
MKQPHANAADPRRLVESLTGKTVPNQVHTRRMTALRLVTPATDFAEGLDLPPLGETASGRPWRLRAVDDGAAAAIAATGLDPIVARVLAARGVTAEAAADYLNPTLRRALPDPFVLTDMDRAVARLAKAVLAGETIGVFGDYDVDGTTAAASLKLYLDDIGAPSSIYLPDRLLEGYGPSIEAFRELASLGARVIVTVDCGAAAHDVIDAAAREGLDVVVFDHHQMTGPPPRAAVVNPNRRDDASGLSNLSAAGVTFLALIALNRALREAGFFNEKREPDLRRLLDLTALGLVCDVMPMTGLARVLVAQGRKVYGKTGNPGLAALGARAGLKGPCSTYHLGFLLGPRINAAGRVGHARLALDLLTTNDPARRAALAEKLHVMNAERQAIEAAVLEEAAQAAEARLAAGDQVIVAAGEGWHPGVIGIVAGRLKELVDRPVVVIGLDGDLGKGSGRSLAGVDLGAAVAAAKASGLLVSGGGHAMAAGLTVSREKVGALTAFLNDRLARDVLAARAARTLAIDGVIAPTAVTRRFADLIESAGPFGPGNPEPVFVLKNLRADFVKPVGKDHLAATFLSESGEAVRGVAFRAAGTRLGAALEEGRRLHAAGKVRADDWRGGEAGQLHLVDVAAAL